MTTAFDSYDRRGLRPSIVHIGPGVFHRAHQAAYSDALLKIGALDGAILGISLRSSSVRDTLAADGFVYPLIERSRGPVDDEIERESTTMIGSLLGVVVAADDVEATLGHLTDPHINVVTITVTERGYCATEPGGQLDLERPEIVHDLTTPTAPKSMPGLVLEALVRRRARGHAPFSVASCDNIPSNGAACARVVLDLAECRDSSLSTWLAGTVSFPSSMVDRMVPATTEADRERCRSRGIADAWPIVTEPFTQWVLEDHFPHGRPDWGRVGVELVSDVRDYEQAKLCMLNAAHSALAYWGLLAGHEFVWQAAADPVLVGATRELLECEVMPTLTTPPGWDLQRYADIVLARFSNRALPYTTVKVAGDGSQKLPARLMPTIRTLVDSDRPAKRCAQVLAAWIATMAGPRSTAFGVVDTALSTGPARDVVGCSDEIAADAAAATLTRLPGFLGPPTATSAHFARLVADQARALWHGDVATMLAGSSATCAQTS